VFEFRADITRGSDERSNGRSARALSQALLASLELRSGASKRLFLCPDGDLCLLPFHALPAGDTDQLIDVWEISYLGSARDLLGFSRRRPPERNPALVLADPDYDLDSVRPSLDATAALEARGLESFLEHVRFEELPGTHAEGERVAAFLGVVPLMRAEATAAAVRACRSPVVLHLATHGFFLEDPRVERVVHEECVVDEDGYSARATPENPLLRSGIALAGANAGKSGCGADRGIMTALEVTGLDFSATELVVLSACQTGLGDVRAGEGVFGLRRAFALSGARTLVLSLWKVPDLATQRLMISFYEELRRGASRPGALRSAMLRIRSTNPRIRDWGAFFCQGFPGPLEAQHGIFQQEPSETRR
jgi:CHAT domain-containing protein